MPSPKHPPSAPGLSISAEVMKANLRWICETPSLMKLSDEQDGAMLLSSSKSNSSVQVQDTAEPMTGVPRRLGYFYENLVTYLINKTLQPIDLKSNVQAISPATGENSTGRVTEGEYDILMRLADSQVCHLELAVKFYLFTGASEQADNQDNCDGMDLSLYVGPNKRDTLHKKWTKLHQQISLSQSNAGARTATELGLMPDECRILIQGYLFYPFGSNSTHIHQHPDINPQHRRGWWLRQSAVQQLHKDAAHYQILPKPYWLAPPPFSISPLLDFDDLSAQTGHLSRPELIARYNAAEQELDRGFIVPDDW